MKITPIAATAAVLALGLSACGGHPSAVSSQGSQSASSSTTGPAAYGDQQSAQAPLVNGKPMWAANRKHTADENAQYQYTKNGGEFGVQSESDYVIKTHAFVDAPPAGAQTIDRANGDRLIYDGKSNTFAVVSRDGAPRTMFKPREGATYWTEQKQREAERAKQDGSQS